MSTKRSLALLGASSLLLSILPAAAMAEGSFSAIPLGVDQLESTDNAQHISALWAKEVKKAETVLIATEANYSDALTSGLLQGKNNAPLFFVNNEKGLDDITKTAFKKLGAKKAIILGGTNAISEDFAASVKKEGLSVSRLGGGARIDTSVKVAESAYPDAKDIPDKTVIVARDDNFADALTAAAFSAKTGYPVLIVNHDAYEWEGKKHELHPAIEAYLNSADIDNVIVAGGPSAVSDTVFNAIKRVVPHTTRTAGSNRVETAQAFAKLWNEPERITVINGEINNKDNKAIAYYNGFASALTAAKANAPIILTNNDLDYSKETFALATAKEGIVAYCGTQVKTTTCANLAATLGVKPQIITLNDDNTPEESAVKMTPADTETVTGASTNSPNRVYTVTGLKADTKYNLVVAKAEMKDGAYTVKMKNKQPEASTDATITVVNGVQANSTEGLMADADGKIVFTLSANKDNVDATVIPVIVEKDKAKEVLAQGGAVTIKPTEVSNSYAFLGKIVSIDKENKTLVVSGNQATASASVDADLGTGGDTALKTFTVSYANAADTFFTPSSAYSLANNQQPADPGINAQMTLAQFEGKLSVGDIVGSKAYYNKTSGLATAFTFQNINPIKVDASKVSGTTKENSVEFEIKKSNASDIFNALKDGQIEVRYHKLSEPITTAMQSGTIDTITDDSSTTAASKFYAGFVALNKDGSSFNQISYNWEQVSGASNDKVTKSVKKIDSLASAKFTNASDKPAESFKFTVEDLDATSSYAFTYRIIAANGEEGEWSTPSADVEGTLSSDTAAQFNTENATIKGEASAAAKATDVFRTTAEPAAITINSLAREQDPFNDGEGTTNTLKLKINNSNFTNAEESKVVVTGSTGGSVSPTSASVSGEDVTLTFTADTFRDANPDITYTVTLKQGALTGAGGLLSGEATITFDYR